MPRQARILSESGIYHVVLRGINQQTIFEDAQDCEKFLNVLEKFKAISEYKIFAYCLMSNHIHLLIQVGKDPLELIIKRIAGSYVYWYNWKYKRCGHLFQDRFKSEPIEDDTYFLAVLRYIHRNPIKAALCGKLDEYKYSSYNEYIGDTRLIDPTLCFGMINREEFAIFNNEKNNDQCLDIDQVSFRMTDDEAGSLILKISKCKSPSDFQKLPIERRDRFLKKLREKGLSIRQISRLTGISFSIVRKF